MSQPDGGIPPLMSGLPPKPPVYYLVVAEILKIDLPRYRAANRLDWIGSDCLKEAGQAIFLPEKPIKSK